MSHPRRTLPAAVAGALAAVLAVSPAPAAPRRNPRPPAAWSADLTVVDADDVGVRWTGAGLRLADTASRPAAQRRQTAGGMLVTAPHPLAAPANRVRADVDATTGTGAVEVAARGWRSGAWTSGGPSPARPSSTSPSPGFRSGWRSPPNGRPPRPPCARSGSSPTRSPPSRPPPRASPTGCTPPARAWSAAPPPTGT
ncbi:hypothetical protein V2I01_39330 [Micromonospora sp. BRA006-A]|nr:hypothetical protein [Micromonospora sp. BRA006-A]